MFKNCLLIAGSWFLLAILSGCVIRTYPLTKDRIDQDLTTGNRGYLQGRAPLEEAKERKTTRTVHVVEIELHPPIKFEKMSKSKYPEKAQAVEMTEDNTIMGNRGEVFSKTAESVSAPAALQANNMEKYTVKKGDTLQRISNKLYGTTKKWTKIYEANKDKLKAPSKIYPGQIINIPVESLKETKENLK